MPSLNGNISITWAKGDGSSTYSTLPITWCSSIMHHSDVRISTQNTTCDHFVCNVVKHTLFNFSAGSSEVVSTNKDLAAAASMAEKNIWNIEAMQWLVPSGNMLATYPHTTLDIYSFKITHNSLLYHYYATCKKDLK